MARNKHGENPSGTAAQCALKKLEVQNKRPVLKTKNVTQATQSARVGAPAQPALAVTTLWAVTSTQSRTGTGLPLAARRRRWKPFQSTTKATLRGHWPYWTKNDTAQNCRAMQQQLTLASTVVLPVFETPSPVFRKPCLGTSLPRSH